MNNAFFHTKKKRIKRKSLTMINCIFHNRKKKKEKKKILSFFLPRLKGLKMIYRFTPEKKEKKNVLQLYYYLALLKTTSSNLERQDLQFNYKIGPPSVVKEIKIVRAGWSRRGKTVQIVNREAFPSRVERNSVRGWTPRYL